ncbi:MAG: hypothetical protein H6728_03950 [Myxococcales bacterium]|nr:hypothetical protein [Myxococcales bacterium]
MTLQPTTDHAPPRPNEQNPPSLPPQHFRRSYPAFWTISGLFLLVTLWLATSPQQVNGSHPKDYPCNLPNTQPYDFPFSLMKPPASPPKAPNFQKGHAHTFFRGVSLGLYFQDQSHDYERFLADIANAGASHVGFVISWYQKNVRSTEIGRHPTKTVNDARLIRTIQQARRQGLQVFLLPIVRLKERGPEDWRGVINPSNLDAWWRSYRNYIFHYAAIAQQHHVELFSVGSELVSMEKHRHRWLRLIRAIRQLFQGNLIYSANWDHYEPVTFWDALDFIGISNYYELSKSINPPLKQLRKTWSDIRIKIEKWKKSYPHQPLLFTEVGYYSQKGTNIYPWDYTRDQPLSLEEQRRCYQAFAEVWSESKILRGAFFWNWFAPGGPKDKSYTPRGKPAECVLRDWFKQHKQRDKKRSYQTRPWLRANYLLSHDRINLEDKKKKEK